MELSGEKLIKASKENVWAALNPAILKSCLPGVETLEKHSDTAGETAASETLGAIAARHTGTVLLSDLDPPNGCTISFMAGDSESNPPNARAKVALSNATGGTRLSYQLEPQGAQLADSPTRAYAEAFFSRFVEVVSASAEPVYHLSHEDHDHDPSNPHYFGLPLGVIIAGVIAAAAVGITVAKFFL